MHKKHSSENIVDSSENDVGKYLTPLGEVS